MGCNCSGCPDEDIAAGVITIVEVPEGVTMGGGVTAALPAALPAPQPLKLTPTQKTTTVNALLNAIRLTLVVFPYTRRFVIATSETRASATNGSKRDPPNGLSRRRIVGGKSAPPLVDTVTVNGDGMPFAMDTLNGA